MNILSFVSAMILLLSLAIFASFEQSRVTRINLISQQGYCEANRSVSNLYERFLFKSLGGKSTVQRKVGQTSIKKKEEESKPPKINQACARLNIWPLLHAKKGGEKLLRAALTSLLHNLYEFDSPHSAERFVDEWVDVLKWSIEAYPHAIPLEKVSFRNQTRRELYYKMLKGNGCPSLLELVKVESSPSKICPTHATATLLTGLMGAQKAQQFYRGKGEVGGWRDLFLGRCCNEHPTQVTLERSDKDSSVTVQKRYQIK
jgi:hypothetical protein